MKVEIRSYQTVVFEARATMGFTEAVETGKTSNRIMEDMYRELTEKLADKVKASGMLAKAGTWKREWMSPRDTGTDFVAVVSVEVE